MLKNYFFVILVSALLPLEMKADWVSVDKHHTPDTPPRVTILSDDPNSTVIKFEISGFNVSEFVSENNSYQALDLLTEIFTTEPGSPELPCIAKVLAVPDQAGLSVEVIETGEIQIFNNFNLPPARQSWLEGQPESPYEENIKSYQSEGIYPQEAVKIDPPSVFRDFRIARVSVFPIRYSPSKKELHVVSSITIRVNYGPGEVINPKITAKKDIAPSFGKIYRSFIFNYQSVLDEIYGGKEDGHELMLCIMPDEFIASFQIYADWKRQSGTDIHVTKFSDIGANATNPDIIKAHISDAYHNWEVPPTYVLILGDDGVFPKKIVTYPDYSFPNEDFFVEVEGDDYFPEMMIGRFTHQGDYRLQVMIHKFLMYEKEPYTGNTAWFKKATVCSNNYYESQVYTKRFTADLMLADGGFTSVDTMMSDGDWGSNCTYDLNDVTNAIEEGRSYLNYRGEGWSDGWHANCYEFSTYDVSSLNNGEKFTFVTSIGCGVSMFDTFGGNSFGEEWMEMGSLTAPRGAACFVGPTSNTHTTYNNYLDKGLYMGMFQEGMDTPGQALLRGKLHMYTIFGNEYYVGYHFKIYCILGDPSMHIWKEVPLAVNVDHPSSIPVGNDLVEISVAFESNGQPVENAEVCITGAEIFVTGFTDATGTAYLDLTAEAAETLMVTVRGGNVIPYQDNMLVIQDAVFVETEGVPVVIDLDGNTDGLINPNENCQITYALKNWGLQTANNVQATLTTENPAWVEIVTTAPISFGNIVPGSTITGNPFQFFVKPDCPVGQEITLKLHVTCTGYSWDYYYNKEVEGCDLNFDHYVVFDGGLGNVNFRMDPGETVVVVLSIENGGLDFAPDVTGILTSDDPYITITDSIGTFGTINMNGLAINAENYFVVYASSNCPAGHLADYTVKVSTQNGNYPYQSYLNFQIPVSLAIPSDFTGPDSYGYYAYSSEDSFFEQTPVYNWFELVGIGTQITLPLLSDYTQTINLPFDFTYYGIDYNQVRVSTDGWLAFGSGTQTAPLNTVLPNLDNINNMVAVFWDDLYDDEFFLGKILYYYDNPNHRFIIEWDSLSRNNFVADPVREVFQVILLDPAYYTTESGDGEMIFQYKNIEETESSTLGIENNTQTIGLQYVYNNNYNLTASALMNQTAIKITTEPPFSYMITGVDDHNVAGNNTLHKGYYLEQNHPNPFDSHTVINYFLPGSNHVSLRIFNINGELVCTLQDGQQTGGKYSVEWNGLNSAGNPVIPGIYFYTFQTDDFTQTRKMFILR